ncbi:STRICTOSIDINE SYNTHASE 7 [Spatholobus suberectus]|nr:STRICTOSIDINE SYNTHASE 7 [Spatholobus suberectus]
MIQGLLRVTSNKKVEVLADEVDGLKFNLTDGVDVAKDGTIYFIDATYKYSLDDYYNDIIEGKPHGRGAENITEGPKKGRIGEFCRDLPGMPDNIHYVGQGQYYIAMATIYNSLTPQSDLLLRYPFIRKAVAMVTQYVGKLVGGEWMNPCREFGRKTNCTLL